VSWSHKHYNVAVCPEHGDVEAWDRPYELPSLPYGAFAFSRLASAIELSRLTYANGKGTYAANVRPGATAAGPKKEKHPVREPLRDLRPLCGDGAPHSGHKVPVARRRP
jgi:hypothetical protein